MRSSRPLAECGRLLSGGTPSKAEPSFWGGSIPWFSSKEVKTFELREAELHVTEAGAENGRNLIPPGTVLFVVRGMSLAKEFRVGVTAVPATFNQDVKALVPKDDVDPRYLARCLRWLEPEVLSMTEESSHGTKRLPGHVFEHLPIPLPDLAQQRRIADLLDKGDAVRSKRKAAIALTEELLRSVFLDMFGDIPAKRSKWRFVPLREFLSASSGKSSKPVLASSETGIPVYGGNGINGWATEALYKKPVVVVGRVGQQCGITRLTDGPAWVTDNAIVVNVERPDVLSPVYLMTALQHSPLRASVMRLDLPFINQSTILDYPLPLPPLAEQERFARWRAQVLVTKERLHGGSAVAARLFDALVQQAFRGELGRA